MITLIQQPTKDILLSQQSIPFVVTTSTIGEFELDVVERSFRYLFEIKLLTSKGIYQTYSTVAVPPRPTDLTGFFDCSEIINSALKWDKGNHLGTEIMECPNSIIQFQLVIKERWIDDDGEYITTEGELIGTYNVIKGAVREGLTDYVIDLDTTQEHIPLTRSKILDEDYYVNQSEPFTLSSVTIPPLSGNLLDETHGDFGSFDLGDMVNYSGMTINPTNVSDAQLLSGNAITISGKSLVITTANTLVTTSANLFSFDNIDLENGKTYIFQIYVSTVRLAPGTIPINNDIVFSSSISGVSTSTIEQENVIAHQSELPFKLIQLKFTATSTGQGTITISLGGADLQLWNRKMIFFDNATLRELKEFENELIGGFILVEGKEPTENVIPLPTGYVESVFAFDSLSKCRFDIPCGTYPLIYSDNDLQDQTTGYYKNSLGQPGKYYQVVLVDDEGNIKLLSDKIYQKKDCNRYNSVRLKWLNEFGGFDYFTFEMASQAYIDLVKDNWKITQGEFNSQSEYLEGDDRGYQSLSVLDLEKIFVSSDWVNAKSLPFFKQLFKSQAVYILNPEPYFYDQDVVYKEYPVIVEDLIYNFYDNSIQSKLVNVDLTITFAINPDNKTSNI